MGSDPKQLCEEWFSDTDSAGVAWRTEQAPAPSIAGHWVGAGGEELTLFAPEQRTPDELLSADAAALLAGGTFRPADPMRDGNRLRGQVTADAPAGPATLDVAAIPDNGGTQRLVLQRPLV